MGTGGTLDSTGTSLPRIYHSAAVTPGQRTDVSVYPRATSDRPSLTLAPPASPTQDRAAEAVEEEENMRMLSFSPRQKSKLVNFTPVCSMLH